MKTSDPIAPLRSDLEFQIKPEGTVDIRDPFLLQIFTLDTTLLEIAKQFDGIASAKKIAKCLNKGAAPSMTAKRIREIAEELVDLDLLDRPEVWQKKPVIDNSTPYSIIETTKKKLKVLPETEPHARWSCGSCGACCHGLAVEVNDEEESRISRELYRDILGEGHFIEEAFIDPDRPAVRILRQFKDRGGACIFLEPGGLCAIHARQGMEAKPDACQSFPNMVIHTPDKKARLAIRTNCRTMHESFETGQLLEEQTTHVMRLLETSGGYKLPKKVEMFGDVVSFRTAETTRIRMNEVFDEMGVTAAAIHVLDSELLGGRVHKARMKYGKHMLAYLKAETEADLNVEQGALSTYFTPVKRGHRALRAMKKGKRAPTIPERPQQFLRAQMRNVLYAGGAMTFPDVGLGYAALLLALEATLHSVGKKGSLEAANDAFIAFTTPVIETTAHAWPILDALDRAYAKRLRKEL